jgi:hypothetical protein
MKLPSISSPRPVWIAVGDYMGERIEVKDRSEYTALK